MNSVDPFETLVSEHYEPLYRFALSLSRSEPDARDLTQHTFYVWATKGHQLRDRSKAKTWLFTTLHRAFLAGRRRWDKYIHHDFEELEEQLPAFTPEPADRSDCAEVLRALAGMDGTYQAAVALFYLEDCSYKEIAEILEVPVGTVKSRIARGLTQLRKTLLSDRPGAATPLAELTRDGSLVPVCSAEPAANNPLTNKPRPRLAAEEKQTPTQINKPQPQYLYV